MGGAPDRGRTEPSEQADPHEPLLTITRQRLTFVGWTMTLLAFIVVLNSADMDIVAE